MKTKTIAAFDFDNTLIIKDSLFHFLQFAFGFTTYYKNITLLIPVLILFKLKIYSSKKTKEKVLKYFLNGMDIQYFKDICNSYSNELSKIENSLAINKLKWHQDNLHTIVIISASIDEWIIPWAKGIGVEIVCATKLEVIDEMITGNILYENCNGVEKVKKLLEIFPDKNSYYLYAYGDSEGDKELLEMADYPYYRTF